MVKRISNIIVISVMCILCVGAILLTCIDIPEVESVYTPVEMEYTTSLFGDIMTVNIICSTSIWNNMIDNVEDENYSIVNVEVNGVLYEYCGIRLKGNSSLDTVASSSSERYSFRIKFDEYIDGQTCCGLDTLLLNNVINDCTYMKEYIAYDLFDYMGVDSVLCTYSDISVNGSSWGFYVAVEGYDDSYVMRTYGTLDGNLYKAEMQSSGVSYTGCFEYVGDNVYSYDELLDNVASGDATYDDKSIIVAGIKALSEGDYDVIEQYWDVDSILRYLAVHTTMVNCDSLTGGMTQNFYIYELDGVITLLPWDYNECLGGAFSTGADIINFAIDTPVWNIDMDELPIVDVLLANDDYLELYHSYLAEVCVYLEDIDTKIDNISAMIDSYVEADTDAFTSYSNYQYTVGILSTVLTLRAESITGQLDGTIPSTTAGQNSNSKSLITTYLDISDMSSSNISSSSGGGNIGDNIGGMMGGISMPTAGVSTSSSSSDASSVALWIILCLIIIVVAYKFIEDMRKIR